MTRDTFSEIMLFAGKMDDARTYDGHRRVTRFRVFRGLGNLYVLDMEISHKAPDVEKTLRVGCQCALVDFHAIEGVTTGSVIEMLEEGHSMLDKWQVPTGWIKDQDVPTDSSVGGE